MPNMRAVTDIALKAANMSAIDGLSHGNRCLNEHHITPDNRCGATATRQFNLDGSVRLCDLAASNPIDSMKVLFQQQANSTYFSSWTCSRLD
jgi:hypothetical protein